MNAALADPEHSLIPVPAWMRTHTLYGQGMAFKEIRPAYPAGLHDGTVNIPGLTKGSRIVSTKVPPLFSPTHDQGESYTILDWINEVRDWCMICDQDATKIGKLVSLAIDGNAGVISSQIPPQVMMYGEIQDWNDGQGAQYRTGVEIVLKTALGVYPPNPQVIQMKAVNNWDNFRRKPGENTQSMLARLKIVMHKAYYEGSYVIPQTHIAKKLVQLFNLDTEQYIKYMTPFGGALPSTPAQIDLLEATLARDFTLKESCQAGAVITPLTLLKKDQHVHYVNPDSPDAAAAVSSPGQVIAPAFPVHFMAQGQQQAYPAQVTGTWQPLPINGAAASGSNHYPMDAYPSTEIPEPDEDDDDDMSMESDEPDSDEETWAMEEANDPTPNSFVGIAAECGIPLSANPTTQELDNVVRQCFFKYRRSWRMFRKVAGKAFPRRRGRAMKHQNRRAHKRSAQTGRRKRGFHIRKGNKSWFINLEHVDPDAVECYFGRSGASSKKRKNPRGKDGKPLLCFGCGSDEHLEKQCTNKRSTHVVAGMYPCLLRYSEAGSPDIPPPPPPVGTDRLRREPTEAVEEDDRRVSLVSNYGSSSHLLAAQEPTATTSVQVPLNPLDRACEPKEYDVREDRMDASFCSILEQHGLLAAPLNDFSEPSTTTQLPTTNATPFVMYASPAMMWVPKTTTAQTDLEKGGVMTSTQHFSINTPPTSTPRAEEEQAAGAGANSSSQMASPDAWSQLEDPTMDNKNPWYGGRVQVETRAEVKKKVTIIEDFQSASSGSTSGMYPKVKSSRPPKPNPTVQEPLAPQSVDLSESEEVQQRAHDHCIDEGLLPCFGPMFGPPEQETHQLQERAHQNHQVTELRAKLLEAAKGRSDLIDEMMWEETGRSARQIATEYANKCRIHYNKTLNPYLAERTVNDALDAALHGARHGRGPLAQYQSLFLDALSVHLMQDPEVAHAFTKDTWFLKDNDDDQVGQPCGDRSAPPGTHGLPQSTSLFGKFGGYQQLPIEQQQQPSQPTTPQPTQQLSPTTDSLPTSHQPPAGGGGGPPNGGTTVTAQPSKKHVAVQTEYVEILDNPWQQVLEPSGSTKLQPDPLIHNDAWKVGRQQQQQQQQQQRQRQLSTQHPPSANTGPAVQTGIGTIMDNAQRGASLYSGYDGEPRIDEQSWRQWQGGNKAPGESDREKAIRERAAMAGGISYLLDAAKQGQLFDGGFSTRHIEQQRQVQDAYVRESISQRQLSPMQQALSMDTAAMVSPARLPTNHIKMPPMPQVDKVEQGYGVGEVSPPTNTTSGQISREPDVDAITRQCYTTELSPYPSSLMLFAPGPGHVNPGPNRAELQHGRQSLVGMSGRPPTLSAFGQGGSGLPAQMHSFPTVAELLLAEYEQGRISLPQLQEGSTKIDHAKAFKSMEARYQSFLAAVRLEEEDGESLLIDTGAYHGLAGQDWFDSHSERVRKAGLAHLIEEKPTSVVVSGVGKDSEQCKVIQSVPGATVDGELLTFEAPKIPNSTVPALCGMQTLDEQNMAVVPWSNQLVRVPKGKEHEIIWPQGTTFVQCKRAKTGHMMLPIGHFDKLSSSHNYKAALAFTASSMIEQQKRLETKFPISLPIQDSYKSSAPRTVNAE